ncbi:helix-turn-helix transcriptional regulator [Aeromonas sp. 2692-1]|uniref:LexA family transcriptional regulator n=1 Tax=Aeromonas sp. 2692-1 TaxID=2560029 RepID=UPI00148B2311|nr:XRE family transcriptional regulator [Aeromonas sp. 2692-1]QJT15225.1 helix-turn-helix transcriptional regulator [Aeromonas sp. 2692-1]
MKSDTYEEKSQWGEKNAQGIFDEARIILFRDRLKEAIGEETVRSFSRKCGLSEATLRDYLKGSSYPTLDRLNKIAITSDRKMAWLIGEESGVQESVAKYVVSDVFLDEFALIPGYRVQVSAGHGALSQGETEPYRHLAFRRKWLKWRGFNEKELVIVWSKGDSMEPTISNNDTLVVHLGRTRPVDGHIYVVRNDDQLWVKRLQVLPHAWLLISDNSLYKEIEVPKDEQHTFEVIGQVVHISHDVGE